MSRDRELDPDAERLIDELLDAANDEVDQEPIEPPPFAAVLGRAQRLQPGLVADRPAAPAPTTTDDAQLTAALAPFIDAARAEAQWDIEQQQREGGPGLPGRAGPSRLWVLGGIMAVAAALVLLFGLFDVQRAWRADNTFEGTQAFDHAGTERPLRASAPRIEPAPRPVRRRVAKKADQAPPVSEPVVPEQAAPLEELNPDPPPAEKRRSTKPKPTKAERLAKLDAQAQAQLAAGDTAAAARTLESLVRKGGRSTLVQLAYGDLFTLAYRRGDRPAQAKLWRRYLDTFPRGRFADDARAGLCRHANASRRGGCWERYLADFPAGAYHREAMRSQSESDPGRPALEPSG